MAISFRFFESSCRLPSEIRPWAVWRYAQDLFYKPHREFRARLNAAGTIA